MRPLQISALLLGLALAAPLPAMAQDEGSGPGMPAKGQLTVELNKTEPVEGGGCRAYFLFRNETGNSFEGFEMSLAILDGDGVIDRLLAIDAAPLPVQRTTLKLFEIPELACGDISEILLHDITSCKPQNAEETDCFPMLTLDSKAATRLVK